MDDPSKKKSHKLNIKPRDVLKAVSAWRMYFLFLFVMALTAPLACLEKYNSQITKELGLSTIKANALASVGVWCALPLVLLSGRLVAMTGKQGLCAFLFSIPYPILTGTFRALQSAGNVGVWTRYGVYQSMIAVASPPYILGVVWTMSNARTPTQRSVFSALYVMLTNLTTSFATQIFREGDRPKYLTGLIAVLTLQSMAACLLLTALFVFWYSNKHQLGDAGLPAVTADVEVEATKGQVRIEKKFQYSL